MSWVPAEHVLAAVAGQREVLNDQRARMSAAAQAHATERQKIATEGVQAAEDLARAVLPALDAASIARAAALVGLPGLATEDVPGKLEARRAWLRSRLAQIHEDPTYANAELLRHPRTGTLVTAIAQAEDMRGPAAEVVAACEDHPRFDRLVEVGYGTPAYKGSWWRYSHWVDRSAANEIIAKFPGKTTFAEVLEEHARAAEAVRVYDAEIAEHRAAITAGEALAKEYADLYEEHRTLDARGLDNTRGRIVQHLLSSDTSLVSQRLVAAPDVRMLYLRTSGLAAKLAYLDGIQRAHLTEMDRELSTQEGRLAQVAARTQKRWAPMDSDKYAKLVVDQRPRYDKRWQRYGKVYTQVNAFNRWDRASYYDDLLWWDVMTRGRYDGSYIHEVSSFHQRHPDYAFDPGLLRGRADDPAFAELPDARDAADAAALVAFDAADTDHVSAGLAHSDAS